jgi:hypothetical protein
VEVEVVGRGRLYESLGDKEYLGTQT